MSPEESTTPKRPEPTETREAGHPTFENGTVVDRQPVEDDEGVIHPCGADQLRGTLESSRYSGQGSGFVTMTNIGSSPCTMDGYPRLQMVRKDGTTIPTNVQGNQPPAPSNFVLRPGKRAGFTIVWWTQPYRGTNRGCVEPPATLRVTPPANSDYTVVGTNYPPQAGANNALRPCQDGALHVSGWEKL